LHPKSDSSRGTRNLIPLVGPKTRLVCAAPKRRTSSCLTRNPTLVVAPIILSALQPEIRRFSQRPEIRLFSIDPKSAFLRGTISTSATRTPNPQIRKALTRMLPFTLRVRGSSRACSSLGGSGRGFGLSFTLCFLLLWCTPHRRFACVRLADSKPGVSPEAGPSQTVFLACTRNPPFAMYPKSGSSRRTQNPNLDFGPNSASCRDPKSDSSRACPPFRWSFLLLSVVSV